MSLLLPQELIDFLVPSVSQLFKIEKSRAVSELKDSCKIFDKFISEPSTQFIIIRNPGQLSVRTVLENCSGPILFIQKSVRQLLKTSFLSAIVMIPLQSDDILSLMQNIVGKLFLPVLQNSSQDDSDTIQDDLFESLESFNISMERCKNRKCFPETNLDISDELFSTINENTNPTPEQESHILTEIENWQVNAGSIIKYSKKPPEFNSLKEELSFWPLIESRIVNIIDQIDKLKNSYLPTVIKKHRKMFPSYLDKIEKETEKLSENIIPFAEALSEFDSTLFDRVTSLKQLQECIEIASSFFADKFTNDFTFEFRSVQLFSLINKEAMQRFTNIMSKIKVLSLPIEEFTEKETSVHDLIKDWDEQNENVVLKLKDSGFYHSINKENISIKKLKKKILNFMTEVKEISKDYHQLSEQLDLHPEVVSSELKAKLRVAFEKLSENAILDLSKEGAYKWAISVNEYNKSLESIEIKISQVIEATISNIKSIVEIQKIFINLKEIVNRPTIQSFLHQYQNKFIDSIKTQLTNIQKKDLENISKQSIVTYLLNKGETGEGAKLILVKRASSKVEKLKEMLCDVIGERWMDVNNCQDMVSLIKSIENVIEKMNDQTRLMDQFHNVSDSLGAVLFDIVTRHNNRTLICKYSPAVANTLTTFRAAKQMDISVDSEAVINIETMQKRYNRYIQLNEALLQWNETIKHLEPELILISPDYLDNIYGLIEKGWNSSWLDSDINDYINEFSKTIYNFRGDLQIARNVNLKVENLLTKLQEIDEPYTIRETLAEIITSTDVLFNSTKFRNSEVYFETLNQRIADILSRKVSKTYYLWKESLELNQPIRNLEAITITITLNSSNISISPPVSQIHPILNRMFTDDINNYLLQMQVCNFAATTQSLFQERINVPSDDINCIFENMSRLSSDVYNYVNEWRQLQYFFTAEPSSISFGNSIGDWISFLTELVKLFQRFKKYPAIKSFGAVEVDTSKIQPHVISRLTEWNKEIVRALRLHAREAISTMRKEINESKEVVERTIPSNARDIAPFLNEFKVAGAQLTNWKETLPHLENAARLCKLEELAEFKKIYEVFTKVYTEKKREIDNNKQALCEKVDNETTTLIKNINTLQKKWEKVRPSNGSVTPDKANSTLVKFENAFKKMNTIWEQISSAREAVGLPITVSTELGGMIDDCEVIKEVWANLTVIHTKITALLSQPFSTFVPQEFKGKIFSLLEKLTAMPDHIKNYEVWNFYNQKVKSLLKIYPILEGLKSPAILSRHWALIGSHFKIQIDLEKITLQQISDLELEKNAEFIGEIMRKAQGEFSLYQYLEQLNMTWGQLQFEFSAYKQKYQLIKGWDVIMTTISDHLNFLGTMQTSPFFQVFREQAMDWTSRLNTLQVLLDEWLDVQRRFVYLEGVFNSQDIKNLLAKASTNFKKNEKDFIRITKQALQLKLVIKISTIPNIDQTLTMLNDNLLQLQKELSDYLEKQRSYFPRFFFIGDEDLLEIIGKSSQITEIQKHFSKMFEGISSVTQDNNSITEVICNEGEHAVLMRPVSTQAAVYKILSDLESEVHNSLHEQLLVAANEFNEFWVNMSIDRLKMFIENYPTQIVLLSFFIVSTIVIEKSIATGSVDKTTKEIISFIDLLSKLVFTDINALTRYSIQQLITESVHQRNLTREIGNIETINDFEWTRFLRFYINNENKDVETRIGDASFIYGFEYLGMCPSLVRTPLTDRVYLTLAQALFAKLGGSSFGPAGTGKTETVKNMGHHLGRHVLVFNCDETFDFKAIGRILVGLCQCGSWGCFDEFNRLDEQMLSAVSQQIQTIQIGLKSNNKSIQILGRTTPLHQNIGIFITMNPGYAGRVELPDNLKQLFRTMAMNKPDTELITEVLLFSHGFSSAEMLAPKFVSLFSMAKESLSKQTHYDFGLRAMKSVLTNAGQLIQMNNSSSLEVESKLLISSIVNTLFPKLLANDLSKLKQIIEDVFPGVTPEDIKQEEVLKLIKQESEKAGWVPSEVWVNKIIQLYYIQQINHGFMLVGPSATGKTSARTVLLNVLSLIDKQESVSYVISPKSVTKDTLFGCLDQVTREWTDGVFTRILRTIVNDQRGEMSKRHWIIFDGDVDPEWVENLNSLLDDNKLLTLPNGERISLPSNVRIVFEIANLNYATPATVSRCGIVYFSQNTLSTKDITNYHIKLLANEPIITQNNILASEYIDISLPDMKDKQKMYTETISELIIQIINECETFWVEHKDKSDMNIPFASCLAAFFALIKASFIYCLRSDYNEQVLKMSSIFAAFWAFGAQFGPELRKQFDSLLRGKFTKYSPSDSLLFHYISYEEKCWVSALGENSIGPDGYLVTPETEVERRAINMSIIGGRTIILCGDKGCGKRALFNSALSQYVDAQIINISLSNCSSIDFVLQIFEQFTTYVKSSTSLKMRPKNASSYIIFIFNDMNLPSLDKYGTQKVIEFLRQIIEMNGFWHPHRREWIQLELIMFAGMCSPPSAFGRVKISKRFLRHSSVINIQPPGKDALHSIIRGLLDKEGADSSNKCTLNKDEIANCVCEFYSDFKENFRASELTHYIANLKDLVSWIESLLFAIESSQGTSQIHILFYEGLRVFADRLQTTKEKEIIKEMLLNSISNAFSDISDYDSSLLENQIVYTRITDKNHKYTPLEYDKVTKTLTNKMKDYCDENICNELVFFDEAVEEYSKIERILSQPGGHMIIIGQSGTGKIQMTNFAAWCLDMPVFRLRIHKEYTIQDFDADIRRILKTCLESNICLLVKETDLVLPIFIERLNVLLSQNNIPGLFQGDEYNNLISQAKDAARLAGAIIDNDDSIFQFFIDKVSTNLHFVYVSNSENIDMNQRDIMFPSLFEKCNICWIGTWADESLTYFIKSVLARNGLTVDDSLIQTLINIHKNSYQLSESLPISNYVSPRYFFTFIEQYCKISIEKKKTLSVEKEHLSQGLSKLNQTQEEVKKMGTELTTKKKLLKEAEIKAEQKLEEIIKDKEQTKVKQEEAEKIKLQLDEKTKIIQVDKEKAQKELDAVGPIIEEASKSVQNIKKSNLDEIRRLASPPDVIKNTLSCVLILLGHNVSNWTGIRKIISSESFIKSVVDFKVDTNITSSIKKARQLINSTDLNYEKAERASKACGPLFKWLDANIKYLEIIDSTEPLRAKVADLEKEANNLQKQHENMSSTIKLLERRLKKITLEYQQLNSQCDKTRKEAEHVEIKLSRAQNLLSSLTSETKRWVERNEALQSDFDNVAGNSIISSAFIAYCGFLEQQRRIDALIGWESILSDYNIKYNEEFQFVDFMCSSSQLMEWNKKELPKDDLSIQNAIILDSLNNVKNIRIPFIIDPVGQATTFLMNMHEKMVKTSFVDPKFSKHLESCLRFGTPLLVEDGEQFDQLVLPVLNYEFKKSGGRILLNLKKTEIDISPDFKMYIVTRDTDFVPQPSIASLTTLVNFSVTSLSLKAQCMTKLLRVKLPDIETRRQELHQTLAAMQVSLGALEDKMLTVFSETKGQILENDELLHLLENIKKESTSIKQKAEETHATLQEISTTSEQFAKVADFATKIYFSLKNMSVIHFLYQFSLNFFWSIFNESIKMNYTPDKLIDHMANCFFVSCSYSILDIHLPVLGFRFAQILLEQKEVEVDDSLYELALRGSSMGNREPMFIKEICSNKEQNNYISEWLSTDAPEHTIPDQIMKILKENQDEHPAIVALKTLSVMRRVRQDRIVAAANEFIVKAFGYDILDIPPLDLLPISIESGNSTPILLCSAAGHDPSARIEACAEISKKHIDSVAVGAADSYKMIEDTVSSASQKGDWVIVKNVHLAPIWIRKFIKTVESLDADPSFRLFFTSEINPKVGSSVFRACRIIAIEPATGIKANLRRILTSGIAWTDQSDVPKERGKLIVNFMWLHAIIMERLRFVPLGWCKTYEFNDSDLRFSMDVVSRWTKKSEQLSWSGLRFLSSKNIYGGKIDITSDQRCIAALSSSILKPDSVIGNEALGISEPSDITSSESCKKWIETIPSNESPEILFLPKNSGKFLFIQQGNQTMQNILSVSAGAELSRNESKKTNFVKTLIEKWNEKLTELEVSQFNIDESNPMAYVIKEEINSILTTKQTITNDIQVIIDAITNGNAFSQKDIRIIEDLNRESVPSAWNKHNFFCADLHTWINDFICRISALNSYACDKKLGRKRISLGYFGSPETFIAASKQVAARENKWQIEKMKIKLVFAPAKLTSNADICLTGLTLLASKWSAEEGKLVPSDDVINPCPPLLITWTEGEEKDKADQSIIVPIFMTQSKKRVIAEGLVPVSNCQSLEWWTIRNPGIVIQKNAI